MYMSNAARMCARMHAHKLNFLRRAIHDVGATLARHGGHDSMTSTGRVLFSKGDSTVAAPRGEIARRHKQPEHVTIGWKNNRTSFVRCKRSCEQNMLKGLTRLRLVWMENISFKHTNHDDESELREHRFR